MDNLEKMLKATLLYDLYKPLLTDRQRTYFEDYYFTNLSLAEVADKYGVSRNAIYSQLTQINEELDEFETKLHLQKKGRRREEILDGLRKNATPEQLELLDKLEEAC